MTRKQEIIQAGLIQEGVSTDKEMKCFVLGAEWADSHPVNQWHKVEEFPPKDAKHKGWSVKVIVINDGQYEIGLYDYKLKRWCVPGCINPYFTNITHWKTFPKLSKKK